MRTRFFEPAAPSTSKSRWATDVTRRHAVFLLLVSVTLGLAGCARVQPWDRDLLADPRMQIGGEGVQAGLDDHIYFSKEASSGGRGFGAGGCGCN